jgi:putative FmdB family regulatory protein
MSKVMPFDWRCQSCGHKFEQWCRADKREMECPLCASASKRLVSAARFPLSQGVDPSLPTLADKWSRMHEQGRKVDEARSKEHGNDAWGADGADVRR